MATVRIDRDPMGTMVQSTASTSSTSTSSTHPVPTGPAGRAMAQPMDAALLEGLQQHLTMERQASASYWAMAIWFAERELRGFCHYLKSESGNEQHHAGLVADYLVARGQTVLLDAVAAPRQQWRDAEEIFGAIFQMEADVTTSLQQLYAMAERAGDVRTTVFLDPIVQGQIDSENEAAHLLGRIRFAQANPAAMLVIDGELSADKHAPGSLA
jgi:ferritin